tara:strand:- start:725 stop:961 length:237 start_codon:yes stop_codon:yes gene_type:complete
MSKPGYKSTEFWLSSSAMLGGILMASGVFPIESSLGQILGMIMSTLAALGYTGSRASVKKKQAEEEAKWETDETAVAE